MPPPPYVCVRISPGVFACPPSQPPSQVPKGSNNLPRWPGGAPGGILRSRPGGPGPPPPPLRPLTPGLWGISAAGMGRGWDIIFKSIRHLITSLKSTFIGQRKLSQRHENGLNYYTGICRENNCADRRLTIKRRKIEHRFLTNSTMEFIQTTHFSESTAKSIHFFSSFSAPEISPQFMNLAGMMDVETPYGILGLSVLCFSSCVVECGTCVCRDA